MCAIIREAYEERAGQTRRQAGMAAAVDRSPSFHCCSNSGAVIALGSLHSYSTAIEKEQFSLELKCNIGFILHTWFLNPETVKNYRIESIQEIYVSGVDNYSF